LDLYSAEEISSPDALIRADDCSWKLVIFFCLIVPFCPDALKDIPIKRMAIMAAE
jgi:hypothetical protein